MANEMTVTFADGTEKIFPESIEVSVNDYGVLTITDGDDVRKLAPHAWVEVRGQRRAGTVWFA